MKVLLLVVIVFNDHPPVTYKTPTEGAADCYTQALELSKNTPPEGEHIIKYLIGCSFEELAETPT
jgi:hypothetical protein